MFDEFIDGTVQVQMHHIDHADQDHGTGEREIMKTRTLTQGHALELLETTISRRIMPMMLLLRHRSKHFQALRLDCSQPDLQDCYKIWNEVDTDGNGMRDSQDSLNAELWRTVVSRYLPPLQHMWTYHSDADSAFEPSPSSETHPEQLTQEPNNPDMDIHPSIESSEDGNVFQRRPDHLERHPAETTELDSKDSVFDAEATAAAIRQVRGGQPSLSWMYKRVLILAQHGRITDEDTLEWKKALKGNNVAFEAWKKRFTSNDLARLLIQPGQDLTASIKALKAQPEKLYGLLDTLPIPELVMSGLAADFCDTVGNLWPTRK